MDLTKHLLKKCSLSNNWNGSKDALINIKGIERYKRPLPEKEFQAIEEFEELIWRVAFRVDSDAE